MGACLPESVVTNGDLAEKLGVSPEWIEQRTGIRERRHVSGGCSTGDLAVEAGRRALSGSPGAVQALILATTSTDHLVPATAPWVAERLGIGTVAALDVNAACSGFVYALAVANGWLCSGMANRVLVIGADTASGFTDPADPDTAPIFGDGAGAVVLEAGRPGDPGSLGAFDLGSDGTGQEYLHVPAGSRRTSYGVPLSQQAIYMRMEGRELYRHAVRRMSASCRTACELAGWDTDSVTAVVAHQANARILTALAQRLDMPREKFPSNIAEVGNTVAASVPLLLAHTAERRQFQAGDRLILTSFGAGLTWASTTFTWPEL
ncbi:beta-ketoacyl-ACP synthase III [Streptomyces longispororuber]|uniref:beta-ketoacyl-ACP synthase III n=1 Tax=Streptomyces longispororuber TaxID=68230 RepID=UPI00210C79AB|nr:beta-ketoacyl-ACP synthase III [Streptomyces longispororuber]MCQ4210574.1 ketoacyl-ACP synthase III [Streptomyces longispororuber]